MELGRLLPGLRRLRRWRTADVWYHPAYRLPLSSLEGTGMETRRADSVAWYLVEVGAVRKDHLHRPRPVSFSRLAAVHDADYLESLSRAETLAGIFATDPSEIPVDELLHSIRLGAGATVAAARFALATGRHTLNLFGGFHHARRAGGGGFCAVNDVAVAVAAVRARGFRGRIAVLDLDAHPPDGTADCLADDPGVWLGSLSGSDWGPLPPGVDETVLPEGAGDEAYLEALERLLAGMPTPQLAFVLAGGDVLEGDQMGLLALSWRGARARDVRVHQALAQVPTVWLPAGGYHPHSWRVLAGTGLVISGRPWKRIPARYDPLSARFSAIARTLPVSQLSSDDASELSQADVDALFGAASAPAFRLLGFYSAQGIEFALFRYGFLDQVRRLGYRELRVEIDRVGAGDRLRVFGRHGEEEHVLQEAVMERRALAGRTYLFINWLSLRNPKARFSAHRPQLPGQEVPGLGLAREVGELLALIARRLSLAGVAFRPAWYHVAYAGRYRFRFVDPQRQGRFEALVRDMAGIPLLEATRAVAEGRVLLNGAPYAWEPDEMVFPLDRPSGPPEDDAAIREERARCRFALV